MARGGRSSLLEPNPKAHRWFCFLVGFCFRGTRKHAPEAPEDDVDDDDDDDGGGGVKEEEEAL